MSALSQMPEAQGGQLTAQPTNRSTKLSTTAHRLTPPVLIDTRTYQEETALAQETAHLRELDGLPDALQRFLQEEGVSDALLGRVRAVLAADPRLALHPAAGPNPNPAAPHAAAADDEAQRESSAADSCGAYPEFDSYFAEGFALAEEIGALFRYPSSSSSSSHVLRCRHAPRPHAACNRSARSSGLQWQRLRLRLAGSSARAADDAKLMGVWNVRLLQELADRLRGHALRGATASHKSRGLLQQEAQIQARVSEPYSSAPLSIVTVTPPSSLPSQAARNKEIHRVRKLVVVERLVRAWAGARVRAMRRRRAAANKLRNFFFVHVRMHRMRRCVRRIQRRRAAADTLLAALLRYCLCRRGERAAARVLVAWAHAMIHRRRMTRTVRAIRRAAADTCSAHNDRVLQRLELRMREVEALLRECVPEAVVADVRARLSDLGSVQQYSRSRTGVGARGADMTDEVAPLLDRLEDMRRRGGRVRRRLDLGAHSVERYCTCTVHSCMHRIYLFTPSLSHDAPALMSTFVTHLLQHEIVHRRSRAPNAAVGRLCRGRAAPRSPQGPQWRANPASQGQPGLGPSRQLCESRLLSKASSSSSSSQHCSRHRPCRRHPTAAPELSTALRQQFRRRDSIRRI